MAYRKNFQYIMPKQLNNKINEIYCQILSIIIVCIKSYNKTLKGYNKKKVTLKKVKDVI